MNADGLSALQTCDQIIRLKIPNLLRLYLNPFVAQTCVALAEMVWDVWPESKKEGRRSSFLANSGEEALSGALKLARYTQNVRSQNDASITMEAIFAILRRRRLSLMGRMEPMNPSASSSFLRSSHCRRQSS